MGILVSTTVYVRWLACSFIHSGKQSISHHVHCPLTETRRCPESTELNTEDQACLLVERQSVHREREGTRWSGCPDDQEKAEMVRD